MKSLDEMRVSQDVRPQGSNAVASAAMVNRTHRVVRERAATLRDRRSRTRSLWIPLGVSSALLVVLVCAIWTAFEEFEGSPAGLPDTSQMLVLMMWSVPISVMLLAVVWFRRSGAKTESESVR